MKDLSKPSAVCNIIPTMERVNEMLTDIIQGKTVETNADDVNFLSENILFLQDLIENFQDIPKYMHCILK